MSENLQPQEPESGGIGGQPVADPRTTGKDLRLLGAAVRRGWPLTEAMRQLVVNEMALLVAGKTKSNQSEVSARDRVGAAKVLVAADNVNVAREKMDADFEKPADPVNVAVQVNLPGVAAASTDDLLRLEATLREHLAKPPEPGSNGVHPPPSSNGTGKTANGNG